MSWHIFKLRPIPPVLHTIANCEENPTLKVKLKFISMAHFSEKAVKGLYAIKTIIQ